MFQPYIVILTAKGNVKISYNLRRWNLSGVVITFELNGGWTNCRFCDIFEM
jgi:hypothetical protein